MKRTYTPALYLIMKQKGFNISTLSRAIGVSRPTLMAWLDRPLMMNGSDRLRFCKPLGMKLAELDQILFYKEKVKVK